MSNSLESNLEAIDLEQIFEEYSRIISQSWVSEKFGKIQKFESETEAFCVLLETLETISEESLTSRSCSPTLTASPKLIKIDGEQIEDLLKTGYLDEACKEWKSKNFEFIQNLSAASNFYYLRQILVFTEKNTEKIEEKEIEIQNIIRSYETLQQAFEALKMKKILGNEETMTTEDSELRRMNEELLEQIDQLEFSKGEIENVLRCKVREFSREIENFREISEDKSRKIGELSDLVAEIEEKYQGEIEKIGLEHEVEVKKFEEALQRLQNENIELSEDFKGVSQHKKVYDQSLEDFKKHIQVLESKKSELNVENSKQKAEICEQGQKIESLQINLKSLESQNSSLIQEDKKKTEQILNLNEIIEKLKLEIEEKCDEIFEIQEHNNEIIDFNSEQSETIVNLNFEINALKNENKHALIEIDEKTQELEFFKNVLEKCKQELTVSKELILSQEDGKLNLNKLQKNYQSVLHEYDSQKIKLKKLENELQINLQTINTLSSKIQYIEDYQKSCESRLKTEYFSLCSLFSLTPKPLESLNSYISSIFEIFPNKFQEELQRLDEIIAELTLQLQNQPDNSISTQLSLKSEQIEYLMEQISYSNEVNTNLENQRQACNQLLRDFLGEPCNNDYKGISNLIDRFNMMSKENTALVELVEKERTRVQEMRNLNEKLEDKMKQARFEAADFRDLENGRVDVEVKNLQVLLREYRKHKQEQEKKIQILQLSLEDACKLRDVLADELSEKCEIIENMSKRSMFRSFN